VPNHSHLFSAVIIAASAIAAPGCTPEAHRYIRFPNLFHPGTAAHQRAAAVEHDPFPENDVAPPIVGGRPLGYQAGVVEAERMTMNAAPPPGVAPTIVPGQPVQVPVGAMFNPTPVPVYPAAPAMPPAFTTPPPGTMPPPVVTTPYPPATSMQPAPFTQRQRSPY
jgi:hypothetical protein